ncbi:hypothetical protein G6F55_014130 [Rhizopus delemar]|nr:hypothetical protein G6F55_014130 [Rhizopus delemar]
MRAACAARWWPAGCLPRCGSARPGRAVRCRWRGWRPWSSSCRGSGCAAGQPAAGSSGGGSRRTRRPSRPDRGSGRRSARVRR